MFFVFFINEKFYRFSLPALFDDSVKFVDESNTFLAGDHLKKSIISAFSVYGRLGEGASDNMASSISPVFSKEIL